LNMSHLKKLIDQTFLAILLSLIFLMSGTAMAKVFDRVVAKVNNEIVTLSSVNERVELLRQKYRGDFQGRDEKEVLDEALHTIVEEKLQLQEGKKRGLAVDDSSVEAAVKDIEKKNGLEEGQLAEMLESEGRSMESYKNHIRDQILVSKVVRFELGSRVNISERKIAKYYHENQKDFWDTGKARVRHILILTEKGLSADKKKDKYLRAKEILGEIKRGRDFAAAAKEYSEDISASEGGDVGFVEKGKMVPEFEKAVYSLKEGAISDIVETEYGYHIIKVEEVMTGRTLPLKDVKNKIQFILSNKKQKTAYDEWMGELRESAFIEISLFEDAKMNRSSNLFTSKNERRHNEVSAKPNDSSKKKRLSRNSTKKRKMQDKWEEMYKSVEKSKQPNRSQSGSPLQSLEQKLQRIKELRSDEKITEAEYQKRKQKLLDSL
jgi:peptidyl-prolyl cis-trans isomerase SurA